MQLLLTGDWLCKTLKGEGVRKMRKSSISLKDKMNYIDLESASIIALWMKQVCDYNSNPLA